MFLFIFMSESRKLTELEVQEYINLAELCKVHIKARKKPKTAMKESKAEQRKRIEQFYGSKPS